jgi:hypothetical protein
VKGDNAFAKHVQKVCMLFAALAHLAEELVSALFMLKVESSHI